MKEPSEHDQFVALLAKELPTMGVYGIASLATQIIRHANVIERYAVNMCNREVTERDMARAQRSKDALANLLSPLGIGVICGGDPRGYTTKLILPSKAHNSWGGESEGWGVPTSCRH